MDCAGGAHELAQVAAYALATVDAGLATLGVEVDSLVATVHA